MTTYETQPDGTLREVTSPPPRADLVPVVRCRDCKHAFDEASGYLYCGRRPGHCFETSADGYCAWASRKEGDGDPLDGMSLSALKSEAHWWHGRALEMEAKNEKLEKLVLDMWDFFCVVHDDPLTFKEELDFSVEVWKRMRALGIEIKVEE